MVPGWSGLILQLLIALTDITFPTQKFKNSSQVETVASANKEHRSACLQCYLRALVESFNQRSALGLEDLHLKGATVSRISVQDHRGYVDELKLFSRNHGYSGLVVIFSIGDTVHRVRQQVAVYSSNTDLVTQICCELEGSSSWSLSPECSLGFLQVYNIPLSSDIILVNKELQQLLKELVNRCRSVLTHHPSSRTSSTEGVAGSVEFSQGSSGFNNMDGSDMERAKGGSEDVAPMASAMEDGDQDLRSVEAGAIGELVSPHSSMTMIRSNRSSKESSMFLSDDSPVSDVVAGGGLVGGPGAPFRRNPSPLGLSCLSPPVPPERKKHSSTRNKSNNFDVLSFDPLHHLFSHTVSVGREDGAKTAGSFSLSEFEELSLVDFSGPSSTGGHESRKSSDDNQMIEEIHGNKVIETVVPPTPVNSLVGSNSPSRGGRFFPEDVAEKISGLLHKESISSSLSDTWDELGFDMEEASKCDKTLNTGKHSETLQNTVEDMTEKVAVDDSGRKEISESMIAPQRCMRLEPQLSLNTEQNELHDDWNPDLLLKEQWNPVTLVDLQLTPPEEEGTEKSKRGLTGIKNISSIVRMKVVLSTLTPDASKKEDEAFHCKKGDQQQEPLNFWTYLAQKGLLSSDHGPITSYPESLDMWNMTIRDDSLSPTTPDNLSEQSDSFCAMNTRVGGGALVESPLELSDGGMEMWNTTIQEDSSSTITSPEGQETGQGLGLMGLWDNNDTSQTEDKEQERCTNEGLSQMCEEEEWEGGDGQHKVKIVIEEAENEIHPEELEDIEIPNPQHETSHYQGCDIWDIPVPGMVTSTSEYDNVGAGAWSLRSSPEGNATPLMDNLIDEQSSPFIMLGDPTLLDEGHDKYQTRPSVSEYPTSEVFLFEGDRGLSQMTRNTIDPTENKYNKSEEKSEGVLSDWIEQCNDNSPFVLEGCTPNTMPIKSSPDETTVGLLLSPCLVTCTNHSDVSKGHDYSELHDVPVVYTEDAPAMESQRGFHNEEGNKTETLSLNSSSGGEKDTMKCSPDSLQPGSQDELRSNSDGDSSSGLEMEYIIVSGTVKEDERAWYDRPKEDFRGVQAKVTRKSMETYSMLSYAATILQSQAAHQEHQQSGKQNQMVTDSTLSADKQEYQTVVFQTTLDNSNQYDSSTKDSNQSTNNKYSSHIYSETYPTQSGQSNLGVHASSQSSSGDIHFQEGVNTTQYHMVPETISPSQSKTNTETFQWSGSNMTVCSQTQVEDTQCDDESSISRSLSSSLRYPSDNFLKIREEVYVHSQISMEDSDEGGQSPSTALPCPPSLGNIQVWEDQLLRQDKSKVQSPILTNSSSSQVSSLIGTPLSESDRIIGLPFSGDLMEEEKDDEEQEETAAECTTLLKWSSDIHSDRTEMLNFQRPYLGPSDLLRLTEEQRAGCSFQETDSNTLKTDRFPKYIVNRQSVRTLDCDERLPEQQTGDCETPSFSSWSPTTANGNSSPSSLTRRLQDVTSQLSMQSTNDNVTFHWVQSPPATPSHTQSGYNYHHIDQRTEYQNTHPATRKSTIHQNTDVYAEFTSDAAPEQYRSDWAGNHDQYNLDVPVSKSHYESDSNSMCTSEFQCSEYQTDSQRPNETDCTLYQFDGQMFQSDVRAERDHAQYVPDGYIQFLLSSRPSQQKESTGPMMKKMASSEEAAEETDNQEDPPSSTDLSGGSSQRRKLPAPALNMSLDHSEGSLLSDDTLDTEDEDSDTGDDLDVNLDEMDTPDEAESLELPRKGDSGDVNVHAEPPSTGAVAGRGGAEGGRDSRLWRTVVIGEQEHRIDMKCIEPYKRVISHGGYYAEKNAIIVFAACFLPDSNCDNYHYVMENLFMYVISTLELMVAEDYMIVYLNGATPRRRMPGFSWMKKCYQMIDRRLKKNLKMFIIVHPSWFIRTLLGITRPFISSKFSSKIRYVGSLHELQQIIPMEFVHIPPCILKLDTELKGSTAKADQKKNWAV
ncbi:uncharacterized protein LOC117509960 [Thalassophryne amazonica]|uniref:uncharacterized protein LOC117509960 n=1 Tax=Thalassophryne amazonica TaxID=390379 RepID=UPI001470947B|nr:uncharacterized protein LOC117509960 [Thalassophryne amazonica]